MPIAHHRVHPPIPETRSMNTVKQTRSYNSLMLQRNRIPVFANVHREKARILFAPLKEDKHTVQ